MPFEHYLGRLCEEFGCLPSQAWREWQRLPAGMIEQVLEYRYYAKTKQMYDDTAFNRDARQRLKESGSRMVDLVETITFALVQDEIDRKNRG